MSVIFSNGVAFITSSLFSILRAKPELVGVCLCLCESYLKKRIYAFAIVHNCFCYVKITVICMT